jgi:hypothetical protein
MSDAKAHQEGGLPFTGADTSNRRITEYFAPPPNYPGTGSYEMDNLPPQAPEATHNREAAGVPGAPGAPGAAQEEAFDFQFFAPQKNARRYLVVLVIILALIIVGLAAVAGILGLKLNTVPKPHNSTTTITLTVTERSASTYVHSATLSTLTSTTVGFSVTITSVKTISVPQSATATGTPPLRPTPSPTQDPVPHATCSAVAFAGGGCKVSIWTNYITTNRSVVNLETALDVGCQFQAEIVNWKTSALDMTWMIRRHGTEWTSNKVFEFNVIKIELPKGLQCIKQGIINAGGPSDTQDCDFNPKPDT